MPILCPPRQLDDFESPPQIYVQALLFRFAIQRSSAVDQGVGRVDKIAILVVGKAKALVGQITSKDAHTCVEKLDKFRKLKMKLKRSPEAFASFLLRLGADQEVEGITVAAEETGGEVAAQVAGRAGYEDRHSGSEGAAVLESAVSRAGSTAQSSSRGSRDSSGRPSISG